MSLPALAETDPSPPGQLYDVFDMRLHMLCLGPPDAPGVVLEAGLAGNFLDWSKVQPALAGSLRVCSYDRAGAGFSSRTSRPRTAAAIVEELHVLVREAAVPRPFVLVGHSFGGLLAMSYAKQYPAEVGGLVLVDAMAPDQFERFADAGVELATDPRMVLAGTPAGAAAYGQPPSLRAEAIDLATADKARVFVAREMTRMLASAAQVRDDGLPRLPARVLVHGDREWDGPYPDGRMERTWTVLQNEVAADLGAPPPTVVAGSSHQIPLDAPGAVVEAVQELEDAAAPH
jgi:pimeloyl-ACP methyl ester carboxylesterase